MPKIGFVAIDTQGKWLGGRYYLQHLIRSLSALPSDERLPVCDVWWQQSVDEDPFSEVREFMIDKVIISPPSGLFPRLVRAIKRRLMGSQGAADLFKAHDIGLLFPIPLCANPGIPLMFWLPDFQYKHLPQLYESEMLQYYEQTYKAHVETASQVVLSSQHAYRDFERYFPQHVHKANVVHFCSIPDDSWWRLDPLSIAEKYQLPERFFVLANQFTQHKNHMTVFKALKMLRDRGVRVVVACTGSTYDFRGDGCFSEIRKYLKEHQLNDQIHILGMLPRDEQVALMRRAVAFLQPSSFEGWSTVVEDAKTLGKLILVSDIDVHREQMPRDYVHFLPVHDEQAWADHMVTIITSRTSGPHCDEEERGIKRMKEDKLRYGREFMLAARKAVNLD